MHSTYMMLPGAAHTIVLDFLVLPVVNDSLAYLELMYLWQAYWPPLAAGWMRPPRSFEEVPAADPAARKAWLNCVLSRRCSLTSLLRMFLVAKAWYEYGERLVLPYAKRSLTPFTPLRLPRMTLNAFPRNRIMLLLRGHDFILDKVMVKTLREEAMEQFDDTGFVLSKFACCLAVSGICRCDGSIHNVMKTLWLPCAPPPRLLFDLFRLQARRGLGWIRDSMSLPLHDYDGSSAVDHDNDIPFAMVFLRHGPRTQLMDLLYGVFSYGNGVPGSVLRRTLGDPGRNARDGSWRDTREAQIADYRFHWH
jgi:hypothetical protein